MKFSKWIVLMLVILATVITCVACAGDGNKTTTTTPKATTTTKPKDCGTGKHTVADDAWEITKEATCKSKGERTGICSVCGNEVVEKTNIVDHNWGEELRTEPTCVNVGEIYHVCSVCHEKEQIEELAIVDHEFDVIDDVTGRYSYYNCDSCETNYVRTKETNRDLFYWTTNEVAFVSLENWDENFEVTFPTGFMQYEYNGNVVAAMQDGKLVSGMYVKDRNSNIIKYEDQIVIQLDVMYEAFPTGGKQALFTIEHSGTYVGLVSIDKDGYIGFVDEECYEAPIKDSKLELNTWYNIAVVLDLEGIYDDGSNTETPYYRLPYEIYLDGEKLALETEYEENYDMVEYTADVGEAGWGYKTLAEAESISVRVCDFGRGGAVASYDCSIDNLRIYSGSEVDAPVRGEIDFGDFKVNVEYPTVIEWKTDNTETE